MRRSVLAALLVMTASAAAAVPNPFKDLGQSQIQGSGFILVEPSLDEKVVDRAVVVYHTPDGSFGYGFAIPASMFEKEMIFEGVVSLDIIDGKVLIAVSDEDCKFTLLTATFPDLARVGEVIQPEWVDDIGDTDSGKGGDCPGGRCTCSGPMGPASACCPAGYRPRCRCTQEGSNGFCERTQNSPA